MTFTLRMRGTRTASGARTCRVRMPNASDHERLFFECHCASRCHHRYHCRERKLRYIAVFWAAGANTTCPTMNKWDVERQTAMVSLQSCADWLFDVVQHIIKEFDG